MSHDHQTDIPFAGVPPKFEVIGTVSEAPRVPDGAHAMTVHVVMPPGSPGTPAHRHSGPAYGYVISGAIVFELEGEPERVVRAGETFWEPGGDVIHYQDGNHLADEESSFVVTMFCAPGQPMLTVVPEEELEARKHLRAPRP
ncbi:cupin domain-containing protein [Lentzea alba]|uniref:cupin domain-containing protein n=1 Tax=Lentzea alba TaxID=2714351 RepID=UPI0039BF72AE